MSLKSVLLPQARKCSSETGEDTVGQTIIRNAEAPKLTGVSTKSFTKIKRKQEDYEKQLPEKNRDSNTDMALLSLKASTDDINLQMFIAAGWTKLESIAEINEVEIGDLLLSFEKGMKKENIVT